MESIQAVVNQRKRIAILSRYSVQLLIVNAEPKRSVLFADENNVACPWAGSRFNYTVLFHFGYLLVDGLEVFEWISPKRFAE